jgi:hypothetical protein
MSRREQSEEAPDLEPWANDVRLQDVTLQGKINKVVRIIKTCGCNGESTDRTHAQNQINPHDVGNG